MTERRQIPSVDRLSRLLGEDEASQAARVEAARQAVAWARSEHDAGRSPDPEAIEERAWKALGDWELGSLAPAINMTGVVLHTGLGRARLAPSVAERVSQVAGDHSMVEIDAETGQRGDRQLHVREHLRVLTGCEDSLVVNNCAAAVWLSLMVTCAGGEVILSRGQMVEIGGAFRMPDIVRSSGCHLVEVGCTNKTRLSDFEAAITPETRALLRCHPSNFKMVGFVEMPSPAELASLATARGILFINDAGSGCLVDTTRYGLAKEPTLSEAVADGADLVLASGDKLLGGPQAGIILGKKVAIDRLKRHPIARAIRVDKLTLSALEATLKLYREGKVDEIPVWRYASRDLAWVKRAAQRLAQAWGSGASTVASEAEIGGGSLPGMTIPSWACRITSESADRLQSVLRSENIFARTQDGSVWLDPLTAEDDEVLAVARMLKTIRRS